MSADPTELKRLRWQCRRGMKEMDALLVRYLERCYPAATETEQRAFQALLRTEDDQLWRWLSGRVPPPDPLLAILVNAIIATSAA